jgi:general secretion pathway protein D
MMKKTCFLMLLGVAGFCAGRGVAQEEVTPVIASQVDEVMQRESIRRQELLLKATKSLDDAQSLIAQGKFDEARVKVSDVIKTVPNSGEGAEVYKRANVLLSGLDVNQAREFFRKKDYFNARASAKAALQENTQNQQAYLLLEEINKVLGILPGQDEPANPAVDGKFIVNLNKVSDFIKAGREFEATGQYEAARQAFQQALAIDPNNKVAANEVIRLQKKIGMALEIAHESSTQERKTAVRADWTEQFHLINQEADSVRANSAPISMKNNFLVAQKLRSIVLNNVNFNEATIEDAVRYLTEETRRLDPDGTGINFIIQSDKVKQQSKPFSLRLSNVPVGDLLRYITNLANVRYRVEEYAVFIVPLNVSDDVLVMREFPVRATFFEMENPAGMSDAPKPRRVITTRTGNTGAPSDEIRRSLEARGVQFAEGATAIYNPSTGILAVRNTQDQIDLIEELVTENQGETLQVAVQARFLDINQADLDSLSFNYALYGSTAVLSQILGPGGTTRIAQQSRGDVAVGSNLLGSAGLRQSDGINSVINLSPDIGSAAKPANATISPNRFAYSGVLDGNVFSALIEALSQKSGTDLVTSPSVVVNSGENGKITVAREFSYPIEFDQPQVSPNTMSGGNGNIISNSLNLAPTVIPAWPTQWESRPVGVVLTVKPDVSTDRKRVALSITPEVVEFDGFINYGAQMYSSISGYRNVDDPYTESVVRALSPPRLINQNIINQPVFSVRTVEKARVEVQDGYTMVLGGLIREDISTVDDKIPILGDIPWVGRLFRSKAEQSVKRNLLIFVTVRILRPDGQPLNPSTGSMSNPVASGS